MTVTIYHNPGCSKSRATLALLRERGIEPRIIEYLSTPPDPKTLANILIMLAIEPSALMRKSDPAYAACGLDNAGLSQDDQIALMCANPRVIERPIVVADGQARIGRPPEQVLEII